MKISEPCDEKVELGPMKTYQKKTPIPPLYYTLVQDGPTEWYVDPDKLPDATVGWKCICSTPYRLVKKQWEE